MVSSRGTIGGLDQRLAHSRLYKPGRKRGVAMLFGRGGTRDSWFAFNDALYPDGEIQAITDNGWALGSIDTLTHWGNATIRANITTLKTNCASLWKAGGLHLIGASAGGLSVLNWAKYNPTLVKSITLVIPILDVQDTYDNNRGGFQSEIGTAFGGRPGDADNPAKNYSAFSGFPIHLFYATDDPFTPNAINQAFIAGVGSNVVARSMGAIGHAWAAPWGGDEIARFLRAHDV